jgi:hypothetical protein
MHAAGWNNKLCIRTGLNGSTAAVGSTYYGTGGTITSGQMQYIASKFGYPMLTGGGFPPAATAGHRILPIKPPHTASWSFYRSPEDLAGDASPPDHPSCAVSDGSGCYRYDIANNGRCDLLWEIDY